MSEVEYFEPRPVKSWRNLTDKIVEQRMMHPMFKHWLLMKKMDTEYSRMVRTSMIGKWHYIYRSPKGRISLIKLTDDYGIHDAYPWEICGGGFTEDVERFASKEDAEVRIKELLDC